MIAMPASVFALLPPVTASALSPKLPPNRLDTVEPTDERSSSRIADSVADPDATGASFTAVTLWPSTTVPLLYAVVPPRVETSTVAFVVTVVGLSISTAVRLGADPLKFEAGTKRR